jgi:hypothetical protein
MRPLEYNRRWIDAKLLDLKTDNTVSVSAIARELDKIQVLFDECNNSMHCKSYKGMIESHLTQVCAIVKFIRHVLLTARFHDLGRFIYMQIIHRVLVPWRRDFEMTPDQREALGALSRHLLHEQMDVRQVLHEFPKVQTTCYLCCPPIGTYSEQSWVTFFLRAFQDNLQALGVNVIRENKENDANLGKFVIVVGTEALLSAFNKRSHNAFAKNKFDMLQKRYLADCIGHRTNIMLLMLSGTRVTSVPRFLRQLPTVDMRALGFKRALHSILSVFQTFQ